MSMFEIHGGFTGLAASSRVRLARNIKGYPFRLTEQQHSEIADKIFAALKENPTIGPEFTDVKKDYSDLLYKTVTSLLPLKSKVM